MRANKTITAAICAAGKGERAGFSKNKLLVSLCGEPVLKKTVAAFDFPAIDEIILAVSPANKAEIGELFSGNEKIRLVKGGNTRFESVQNALRQATGEIVLIHDGARPFVSRTMIENCIDCTLQHGSGICAIPATDTIAVGEKGKIIAVPDRTSLWQIQTPQGFFTEELKKAYELASSGQRSYTDDSSVYAAFIGAPTLCDGSNENTKLTHPQDFEKNFARVGFGVDTHAFGKMQNYIVLCGVRVPSESGLLAHSDGDVAVHAIMDALLSAAGLNDIGHYFPDTDEKWKNADSMQMLDEVLRLIRAQGYAVKNLSVAIQAEKPRLKNYIEEMKTRLAAALNVDKNAVGITAGTNEKLGYVGEGKGVTVYATALLKEI
ncbi:MAG: 2-C-methyl-D-erythritol 4-phosphate cytidylyltransferase [Clostridia bacterium]|nr:2-C-methyl-D-erythritol 4-phosphate cytidylyltransferase [Clostridia bacterium]